MSHDCVAVLKAETRSTDCGNTCTAPCVLYRPASQAVQAKDVAAPAKLPYLPASHDVQSETPVANELYAPAAQAVQTEDDDAEATVA